jgi:hypothetical protein
MATEPNDRINDGLTKREHIAIEIMRSMLSTHQSPLYNIAITASQAVELADALITELNKER